MNKIAILLSSRECPRIAICFLFSLTIASISTLPEFVDISGYTLIETIGHYSACFIVPFATQWFLTKALFD
jgi:hypothetical protein